MFFLTRTGPEQLQGFGKENEIKDKVEGGFLLPVDVVGRG